MPRNKSQWKTVLSPSQVAAIRDFLKEGNYPVTQMKFSKKRYYDRLSILFEGYCINGLTYELIGNQLDVTREHARNLFVRYIERIFPRFLTPEQMTHIKRQRRL